MTQDSPYWTHGCDEVDRLPNVRLTLDEATTENGCLRVVPGSHLAGCLPGTDDGAPAGQFLQGPRTLDGGLQKVLAVPVGTLVFFHPPIVHGSRANQSRPPRRAIVLTYQSGVRNPVCAPS